ncbi:MAG: DUF1513 domain-containing protein [Sulfitobacter sp.]
MKTDRRHFLGGLLATGLIPKPTWADAGAPSYLTAAAKPDGSFVLCGVSDGFEILFEVALPSRGHAATAHPARPEAVAFARRPGTYAVVINCVTGEQTAQLNAPEGRHFYGHGTFSQDGNWLFTTENDYEVGRGRIGVWDVTNGYARSGEFSSGGIGPHDIKRLPGTDTLVVANGGIDTHPESGRAKLNIPTMEPNLAYITAGHIDDVMILPSEMHKNSIRHLALSNDGAVAFGMQWQGDEAVASLVGLHRMGVQAILFEAPPEQAGIMNGYIGSIAFEQNAKTIAVTSPRGGLVQIYDAERHTLLDSFTITDVCGVAPHARGYAVTSGTGDIGNLTGSQQTLRKNSAYMWDNHLIVV